MPLFNSTVYTTVTAILFLTFACGNETSTTDTIQTETSTPQTVQQTATTPAAEAQAVANIDYCAFVTLEEIASVMKCDGEIAITPQSTSRSNRCSYRCVDPYAEIIVNFSENENGFAAVIDRKKDNPALVTLDIEGADAVFLMEGQMRFDIYRGKWAITLFPLGAGDDPKAIGLTITKAILAKL